MSKFKKFLYGIMATLGLVIFFLSAIPIGVGTIHLGVVVPMICGVILAVYSLLSLKYPIEDIPWSHEQTEEYIKEMNYLRCSLKNEKPKMRKTIILGMKNANLDEYNEKYESENIAGLYLSRGTRVKINRIMWTVISISLVIILAISIVMVTGYEEFKGDYRGQTIITLGSKIEGSKPSATLKNRLDSTLELLEKYPDSKVIVTGGQGNDEAQPESQVMKKYLVDNGVAENRVLEEDKSTSTKENLEYAAHIAKENDISQEFIIVTDGYHEYRGNKYAKKQNIKSQGYPSKSVQGFGFSYWFREILINTYEIFSL